MKKNWKNILIILLFSILLSLVIFINPIYRSHDTSFHVANILAIEDLIKYGDFFSLVIPNVGFNLGYGTRIFYPPLAHSVTAIFSYIFSLDIAFKIVNFFTIFLSGLSMYFLANKFSKSKYLALFSSLFYISMPYFLSDIYIRCSLAESFLFIFLPLILLGLIYLLEGDVKKFYPLFIIGYIGGMLSHLTLMVYMTVMFAIFLLIYSKKFFKKKKMIHFILACLVILLSTSFFTVPLVVHKLFGDYTVFLDGHMATNISNYALTIFDFNPFRRVGNSLVQHYFPAVVSILILFTCLFRKKIEFPSYTKGIFILGLISFLMISVLFPWDFLPNSFQIIQFPWRMETFLIIVVSLLSPFCLKIVRDTKFINILILAGLLVGASFSTHYAWDVLIDLERISWVDGMGWGYEYLPSKAYSNFDYFENRKYYEIKLLDDTNANIWIVENDIRKLEFFVSDTESEIVVELPRIFYFGYRLIDGDGNILKLTESENGFIETKIKHNGSYKLTYVGFPISRIVSIVSVVLFSISYIYIIFIKNKVIFLTKSKLKL